MRAVGRASPRAASGSSASGRQPPVTGGQLAGKGRRMTDDEKKVDVPDPELLPPRDVMSLINPSPSGLGSGLIGGLPGTDNPIPDAGATPDATHTASDASSFATGHIPPTEAQPTTSDQPQTVPVDS